MTAMADRMDNNHAHGHGPVLTYADDSDHDTDETGYYEAMTEAVRELLIERNIVTADEIRRILERLDAPGSELGPRIVARAWADPHFKTRLLANGNEAVAELGMPPAGSDLADTELVVVENTPEVHNLVVCTLCSCYPRTILGVPPDWYKSKSYRARAVMEPRKVLATFGTNLPDETIVRVHDSNADLRYLVLPMRPDGSERWSEDELAGLVTRDSLIGVSLPKVPTAAS